MNIGIYVYDQAEVLDFSGPFEVFSTAKRLSGNDWNVFLISQTGEPIHARGGFVVLPQYSFENHPELDVLVVVGGVHTEELTKPEVILWTKKIAQDAQLVASVCTGAFILAETGLLDDLTVTTHWEDIVDLQNQYPTLKVLENQRWVQAGKYVTSGGISSGIDMSLFLVCELASESLANKTAHQMEYHWQLAGLY